MKKLITILTVLLSFNGYGLRLMKPGDSHVDQDMPDVPKVSYIVLDEQGSPLCVLNRNAYLKKLESATLNQLNEQDELYSQLKDKKSLPDCEGEWLTMVSPVFEQIQNREQLPRYMVEEYTLRSAERQTAQQIPDYMVEEYASQQIQKYGAEEYALQQMEKNGVEDPHSAYYDAGLLGLPLAGGVLMRVPVLARGFSLLVTKAKNAFQGLRNVLAGGAGATAKYVSQVCGASVATGSGFILVLVPIVGLGLGALQEAHGGKPFLSSNAGPLTLGYMLSGLGLTGPVGLSSLDKLQKIPTSLALKGARAVSAMTLSPFYICGIAGSVSALVLIDQTMMAEDNKVF